jgi:hypothetical protein
MPFKVLVVSEWYTIPSSSLRGTSMEILETTYSLIFYDSATWYSHEVKGTVMYSYLTENVQSFLNNRTFYTRLALLYTTVHVWRFQTTVVIRCALFATVNTATFVQK